MKLTKNQNRFINNKNMGFSLMKGKSLTGKTVAALHRVINLENNYCIYNEDKILYLSSNDKKLYNSKSLYKEKSKESEFYSLFSIDEERVEFNLVKVLIKDFSERYINENKLNLKTISFEEAYKFIKTEDFYNELLLLAKKSKVINKIKSEDLYDEIMWIKACNFTREEYSDVERKGRKYRLIKKSYSRDSIYRLMELYTSILRQNGYCDYYDEISFAIKYGQPYKEKYTHIVLDDVEVLTKGEIEFVKSIYSNHAYSSFVFILNNEFCNDKMCWLVKGRRLKTLGADFKGRSFAFKKEFKEEKNKEKNHMEKFQYVNLKYKNIVEFNIDSSSSKKEIYLEDNTIFNEEELVEVDVYSDIAAGNPIEINDEVEGKFNLPKSWLERGKETFILHVKGDSMIEKNINDGDLVVIKRQNTALNNDIVAASLDGEATLKTLKLNGKEPMLIPANPKYSEIYLQGKEVSILGVAIGVIKNKLN
ncbi:MAG: transcriptional repressor LexA [Clostridium sp.]|nr:transcriptional repressor LexA [Clostridium sp.]